MQRFPRIDPPRGFVLPARRAHKLEKALHDYMRLGDALVQLALMYPMVVPDPSVTITNIGEVLRLARSMRERQPLVGGGDAVDLMLAFLHQMRRRGEGSISAEQLSGLVTTMRTARGVASDLIDRYPDSAAYALADEYNAMHYEPYRVLVVRAAMGMRTVSDARNFLAVADRIPMPRP